MKTKYPIKKEFFPFNKFTAPHGKRIILLSQKFLKTPKFVYKDKELKVETVSINGYKDEKFDFYIISPKTCGSPSPAIIFIHGGGFMFEGFSSHFKIAIMYAKKLNVKLIYVKYKLAPNYPFPYQQYECAKAFNYVFENAEKLGVNPSKIALTGDSAGAFLCVSSQLLSNIEGKIFKPVCQVLIYPWLDGRSNSESNKKYTDTPMWNSTLSKHSKKFTNPNNQKFPPEIASVVEYKDLTRMPPTYIEVAQFDCLHDDGVLFHNVLKKLKIESELHETEGTMHGYDSKFRAPTTQSMLDQRIKYIAKYLK